MQETFLKNLYEENGRMYTKSSYPKPVYGEDVFKRGNAYYRTFSPLRSKLASSIKTGLKPVILENDHILYLGASTGTTVSHLSDIITGGMIFAVEFSAIPFVKLIQLGDERENVFPMLLDGNKPQQYSVLIDRVDLIYQDVSQPNQIEIFEKNMEFFRAKRGILMFKTFSVRADVSIEEQVKKIKEHFQVHQVKDISKFHKGHYAITVSN
ncbi:MAG: fibrillarin-like rRNA/tRNA 2'-O-methyltransferase [Candidatus Thermoplasmatota archaeon]|jgi:fibrillarin-like pre-rRNA processing protein|nr:fibrillarin-like rRNA/tRNA 2'-O-methyltransferase [Candidatus Thermoplasmatota archaeon]MCL5681162.1 fibrillarin-like rRNA/tRNA 2'-O-methyltransferase [Candidatus Thermoplasmatota archaeon]